MIFGVGYDYNAIVDFENTRRTPVILIFNYPGRFIEFLISNIYVKFTKNIFDPYMYFSFKSNFSFPVIIFIFILIYCPIS